MSINYENKSKVKTVTRIILLFECNNKYNWIIKMINKIIIFHSMIQINFNMVMCMCVLAQEQKLFSTVKKFITKALDENTNRLPLKLDEL